MSEAQARLLPYPEPPDPPPATRVTRRTSKTIGAGDIVEVDKRGRRFHAVVVELEQAPSGRFELGVRPLDSRITYRHATVREVVGVWRRATQNSPSSLMSVQPTGPAYQPRSRPSSAGISGSAAASGSPPTAGVGCSTPASSIAPIGLASCARIGVAKCWMLATLTTTGS